MSDAPKTPDEPHDEVVRQVLNTPQGGLGMITGRTIALDGEIGLGALLYLVGEAGAPFGHTQLDIAQARRLRNLLNEALAIDAEPALRQRAHALDPPEVLASPPGVLIFIGVGEEDKGPGVRGLLAYVLSEDGRVLAHQVLMPKMIVQLWQALGEVVRTRGRLDATARANLHGMGVSALAPPKRGESS